MASSSSFEPAELSPRRLSPHAEDGPADRGATTAALGGIINESLCAFLNQAGTIIDIFSLPTDLSLDGSSLIGRPIHTLFDPSSHEAVETAIATHAIARGTLVGADDFTATVHIWTHPSESSRSHTLFFCLNTSKCAVFNASELSERLMHDIHDMGNTCTAMMAQAAALRALGLPSREADTHLTSLQRSLEDLTRATRESLSLRPTPSLFEMPTCENFSLEEMVSHFFSSFFLVAHTEGVRFILPTVPDGLPATCWGPRSAITQIVVNFLKNAINYTKSKQGEEPVTKEIRLEVKLAREQDPDFPYTLCFAVRDTGTGIKEQDRLAVFLPRQRRSVSHVPGHGLGLSSCKGLAQRIGGKLFIESRYGVGSCFSIEVPVLSELRPPARRAANLSDLEVAVIDDNDLCRDVNARLLARSGFSEERIHRCATHEQAQSLLEDRNIDFILTDYQLDGRNNASTLLSSLRRREQIRGADPIPVLLLTGESDAPHIKALAPCLASNILEKPLPLSRLQEYLVTYFDPIETVNDAGDC